MQEWQKEDSDRRSVLVIATDSNVSYNGLSGYSLPVILSLVVTMEDDKNFKEVVEGALKAVENPIDKLALSVATKKFSNEHGIKESKSDSKEQSSEDSYLKDLFKSMLSGLADKL